MAKMRSVQVSRPKGDFELVEREIPEPAAGCVRVKVQACGICHSDSLTKEGLFPGIAPRVPRHEIAGVTMRSALAFAVGSRGSASASARSSGVQFAAKMGFETVAIARGADKEALAKTLGARHYIDSQAQNPADLDRLAGYDALQRADRRAVDE